MSIYEHPTPSRLLRTGEVAKLIGLSVRTLEKHRCHGTGPAYHKVGGRVVYDPQEIRQWTLKGLRHATSDVVAPPSLEVGALKITPYLTSPYDQGLSGGGGPYRHV